jgi:hypothetical protein
MAIENCLFMEENLIKIGCNLAASASKIPCTS